MNRLTRISLFALVALAQLAAPAWMIGQREWILTHGTVYKFRTAPVDPYDPFRGRYVMLSFGENTAPWAGPGPVPFDDFMRRPLVYASLTTGEDGFAKFTNAGFDQPSTGDFLKTKAYADYDSDKNYLLRSDRIALELPFDRFYMNAGKAPSAEEAYRRHSNRKIQDAYVAVRVWKGRAVIENLYIGDLTMKQFLDQPSEKP